MSVLALVLSLPVALLGVWYLVNPTAAQRLAGLEEQRANRVRVRLRQANGVIMILLGVVLYVAISRTFVPEGQTPGMAGLLAWVVLLPLLVGMLVLAWLDVRLTRKLRRELPARIAAARARAGAKGVAVAGLALLVGLAAATGCNNERANDRPAPPAEPAAPEQQERDPRAQNLPRIPVEISGETFQLQLANTPEERETGLMWRRHLDPDEGMLFVFPDARLRSFWMKNTFVPLDIIYLDSQQRVINVEQMAARDLRHAWSRGPAKYAIELPLGTAERLGVAPGQRIELPEEALDAEW